MDLVTELSWIAVGVIYVLAGFGVVVISKFVKDLFTPYKLDEELTKKDNLAVGVASTGYLAAVLIVFMGAATGPSQTAEPVWLDVARELGIDLAYAAFGILALNLNRILISQCILYKFSIHKEIIEDRNVGTGAVEGGCMMAAALVIAGAIHGEGDIYSALAFCAVGLAVLVVFGLFFQWLTSYDIHAEIEADNVPAGVELGMNMIAIGIVLLKATYADFYSWSENFMMLALYSIVGFITLLLIRKLVDRFLLLGTTMQHEIVENRNLNAALIGGSLAIGMATTILMLF